MGKIMPILEVGEHVFHSSAAAASSSITPQNDRAAIVERVSVTNVSANDNWRVSVNGKELHAFRMLTDGNQQLLGVADATTASRMFAPDTFFDFMDDIGASGESDVPVPNGQTYKIASDGGATGDILITYKEVYHSAIHTSMTNHTNGKVLVAPLYGYVNGAVAAAGDVALDTAVRPSYVPDIFTAPSPGPLPQGWQIEPLALFVEAGGVNAYAAATDHLSSTNYVRVSHKGTKLFTREDTGITALGTAAAAGSANKVYGGRSNRFRPFGAFGDKRRNRLHHFPVLKGGQLLKWYLNVAGDVGAGADYSHHMIVVIARIHSESGLG